MNLLSNDRGGGGGGVPYEALQVSRIPLGFRFACRPVAVGVDALVGINCGMLRGVVGLRPQVLSTNVDSRIQYMLRSRLDRGQRVIRTVRCESCDIILNSEQQAKQHYNGRLHQRRLRQQSQRLSGDESQREATNEHRPFAGSKRKRSEALEENSTAAAKRRRKEDVNEISEENLNAAQSNISAITTDTDVKRALEKVTMTSPMEENDVKEEEEGSKDSLSESKVIQVNKIDQKQLNISVETKRTYHNSSAKLVSEAIALPVPGLRPTSQLTPTTGHGILGGGVFVVPQSIRSSYTVNPWQSSAWFPQVTHLQNFGRPNIVFDPNAVVYVTRNSESPAVMVMTTAPRRIVGRHSLPQPEIGATSFPDDVTVGPTTLTRNEPVQKSTQWGSDESEPSASKSLDSYSANSRSTSQNGVKSHHRRRQRRRRRPDLTRTPV